MQRTVKGIKFTYANHTINENGELVSALDSIVIAETNEKKALKKAFKQVGTFKPLKTENVEKLFVLDDEIFFKYAVEVEPKNT